MNVGLLLYLGLGNSGSSIKFISHNKHVLVYLVQLARINFTWSLVLQVSQEILADVDTPDIEQIHSCNQESGTSGYMVQYQHGYMVQYQHGYMVLYQHGQHWYLGMCHNYLNGGWWINIPV